MEKDIWTSTDSENNGVNIITGGWNLAVIDRASLDYWCHERQMSKPLISSHHGTEPKVGSANLPKNYNYNNVKSTKCNQKVSKALLQ